MLSVVIATLDSERALVRSLAPLVAGATSGLVREVLVADGGSSDETAAVADFAGCHFMRMSAALAPRLNAAAAKARAPWLMFMQPGTVLDVSWTDEVRHLCARGLPGDHAAAFRQRAPTGARRVPALLRMVLGSAPQPEQGLLIPKAFYETLGGHSDHTADPEADLVRRVGARRIFIMASTATMTS